MVVGEVVAGEVDEVLDEVAADEVAGDEVAADEVAAVAITSSEKGRSALRSIKPAENIVSCNKIRRTRKHCGGSKI